MKRSRRGIAFRAAWQGLFCGVLLAFAVALPAQQTLESSSDPASPASKISTFSQIQPAASQTAAPLTMNARFDIYARGLISPGSLIRPVMGAGIGQWRNSPEEWRQGAAGYGRRLASEYGRSILANTISFSVAAMDHEDPRFIPSHARGFWRRTGRAIAGTFVTHTDRGGRIPAYSRFAGHYGAAFISNAWYPEREATIGGAMKRGSTALIFPVMWGVVQEFGPEIRSLIPLGRK